MGFQDHLGEQFDDPVESSAIRYPDSSSSLDFARAKYPEFCLLAASRWTHTISGMPVRILDTFDMLFAVHRQSMITFHNLPRKYRKVPLLINHFVQIRLYSPRPGNSATPPEKQPNAKTHV
jgi:hypothetical protein